MADDDVVKYPDVEDPAGFDELGGDLDVILTRGRIPRRMVVHEYHSCRMMNDRWAKHLAGMHDTSSEVSLTDRDISYETIPSVEQHHDKMLGGHARH